VNINKFCRPIRLSLTKREEEIAVLLAHGGCIKSIAFTLFLSTKTVETHAHNIYFKLGINCRYDLIVWCAKAGLHHELQYVDPTKRTLVVTVPSKSMVGA
jgi:DNA-binding NarL/FixJ family response regulator